MLFRAVSIFAMKSVLYPSADIRYSTYQPPNYLSPFSLAADELPTVETVQALWLKNSSSGTYFSSL